MKNKKLKVAFVHPDLGIGGAERLVLDVAGALKKKEIDVFFITNHFDKSHAFEDLKNDDYQVKVIGDWLPRSVFGRFQAMCAYIRMIYLILVYILFMQKQDQPDVYFVDLIPISIPFLKWRNQKVIYYCHHPDLLASAPGGKLKKLYRKPLDWLELKATAMSDIILVNSEYTSKVFRNTFPEISKSLHILYPTIAATYQDTVTKLASPKNIHDLVPQVQSKAGNEIVFLSVNRFHPAKKLELAIEAVDHLRTITSTEEWRRVVFIMAGGYDPSSQINYTYYEKLVKLTAEKQLENKIIFLKSPSDKLKAELLMSCTCLVYTPINEHFGIVPLEAMTVAKPVIACNSGGPRETVDHGRTGYLCEPTAQSMAQFMLRIVSESNVKQMGLNGKKRLDEKFSYNSFTNKLERILNSVGAEKKKKTKNL